MHNNLACWFLKDPVSRSNPCRAVQILAQGPLFVEHHSPRPLFGIVPFHSGVVFKDCGTLFPIFVILYVKILFQYSFTAGKGMVIQHNDTTVAGCGFWRFLIQHIGIACVGLKTVIWRSFLRVVLLCRIDWGEMAAKGILESAEVVAPRRLITC